MIEEIAKLLKNRNQLAQQAIQQYEPRVNNIIASNSKDVNQICYIMDFMLDFCYNDKMLLLYRRLCRYLLNIDPQASVSYIQAYREMWDEEGKDFGNKKNINDEVQNPY
jgi:hypothetical protein